MCGGCGTGRGLPRWEDRLEPATRRVLAARASVANRLLGPTRLRVTAWGSGYQVADGRGRSTLAADLDELWRTCAVRGTRLSGWAGPSTPGDLEEELGSPASDALELDTLERDTLERDTVVLDPRSSADRPLLGVWAAYVARLTPLPGPLRLVVPGSDGGALSLTIRRSGVEATPLPTGSAAAVVSGAGAQAAAEHLHRYAGLSEPVGAGG